MLEGFQGIDDLSGPTHGTQPQVDPVKMTFMSHLSHSSSESAGKADGLLVVTLVRAKIEEVNIRAVVQLPATQLPQSQNSEVESGIKLILQ